MDPLLLLSVAVVLMAVAGAALAAVRVAAHLDERATRRKAEKREAVEAKFTHKPEPLETEPVTLAAETKPLPRKREKPFELSRFAAIAAVVVFALGIALFAYSATEYVLTNVQTLAAAVVRLGLLFGAYALWDWRISHNTVQKVYEHGNMAVATLIAGLLIAAAIAIS